MEIFGFVAALVIGFLFTLGGLGLFVADGDRTLNVMKGIIFTVIGVLLLYWGQDWFFDHYDIVRTK
jgi:hypothetical protein